MTETAARPYLAVVLGTALSALAPAPSAQTVADLDRYCVACWRNARLPVDQWADCTQEVYRRLLERVPARAWPELLARDGDERRELIRAVDAVKKRVQRARRAGGSLDGVADRSDGDRRARADEREAVRAAAAELLTPRQRRVLQLSLEGWSVAELADELSLPPERVSDEKYKAVRKLRAHLAGRGDGSAPA